MTTFANLGFLAIVGFVVWSLAAAAAQVTPVEARPRSFRTWCWVGVAWLAVTGLPTLVGFLRPDGPLPVQAFLLPLLVLAIGFGMSSRGEAIARTIPIWALVGFQGFRLPLELVLHRWAEVGIAPPQMTWTGQNVDIVAGAVALLAIPLMRRRPGFGWVPTLIGIGLLLNIGRIVLTSLPGPLQRFPDALTLPNQFPQVWIGTVCVVGAALGHVLAVRALRHNRRVATP